MPGEEQDSSKSTHDALEEKLLQVLAGEDHASAEAAIGALLQKLRDKAQKTSGGSLEDLTKLQEALAYQLEEVRREAQEAEERAEEQRRATIELLSPRMSSLGCAVLIGVSQTALKEEMVGLEAKMVNMEEELKGCTEGLQVELGATVEAEIDRLRMKSEAVPQTCTKMEDTELLFQEMQRMNGSPQPRGLARGSHLLSPPASPTPDGVYENLSKEELVERIKLLDSKLKSVVALVNQFQMNAQLESALLKATKQQP